MNNLKQKSIVWLMPIFLFYIRMAPTVIAATDPTSMIRHDPHLQAQFYFRRGVAFQEQEQPDSAIQAFETAIKLDRRMADAYYQLARLYMDKNTVYSRFLATRRLDEAIRLDWNNVDYRFTRALLYLAKDMSASALREFKRVVKLDPENYRAYYHIGLIIERDCLYYRDLIDPEANAIIYFRKFSENDKQKVLYNYNKAIAINPQFNEVYYRLGLIYYEFGDLDEMISLLEKAVVINPNDKNCHLFLGFAYHQAERFEAAYSEYMKAMQLMEEDEKDIFSSIEMLLTPEQKEKFRQAGPRNRKRMEQSFWNQHDPFFLTPANERLLEHYSRVAYANLRFFVPLKNIDGWKTDQGKVYIRFGKPLQLYRTRAELASSLVDGSPLITSKEVWTYPDFNMVFEDRSLMRRYEFAWGDSPENDYRTVYQELIRKTPERFDYFPQSRELPLIARPVFFRARNYQSLVHVDAAIPGDSLHFLLSQDQWKATIRSGLFIRDMVWNSQAVDSGTVIVPETDLHTILNTRYSLHSLAAATTPGPHHISVEFLDVASGKRGVYRTAVDVDTFHSDRLQLSDVLMALSIEPDSVLPSMQKEHLKIVPNPLRMSGPTVPLYIYYEIYGLRVNDEGATNFRIEYRVGNNRQRDSVFRRLLTSMKLMRQRGVITVAYDYTGNSVTEYQYHRLDVPAHLSGNLLLEVVVTDLLTKQKANRKLEFSIRSTE